MRWLSRLCAAFHHHPDQRSSSPIPMGPISHSPVTEVSEVARQRSHRRPRGSYSTCSAIFEAGKSVGGHTPPLQGRMKALFYLHSVREGRPETHARPASRNLAAVPPLTLQNPNDRRYCVPVPRRRRRTEEFVDLAKIAD